MRTKLYKRLKCELKVIRKTYEQVLKSDESSGFGEWICDNYYILDNAGREAQKDLKAMREIPENKNGIPVLFELCGELCDSGMVSDDDIISFFTDKGLNGAEAEQLPLVMTCVLLHKAYDSCVKFMSGNGGTEIIACVIKQFRAMPDIDFPEIMQQISPVERLFNQDPSGIYPQMDEQSKSLYRTLLANSAKRNHTDDESELKRIIKLALAGTDERKRDIGCLLSVGEKHTRGILSIVAEAVVPTVVAVALGLITGLWYLPFLLLLPLWEVLRYPVEMLFIKGVSPRALPRLELGDEIPGNARTLITVSTLLPGAGKSEELKRHLRRLWLSNGGKHVKICVLADLKTADVPEKAEDESDINAAKRVVDELNTQYGGGFLLIVRQRTFSPTQGNYTGKERKRGAITQLVEYIKGGKSEFRELCGDLSDIKKTRYLLALDSDTDIPMNTAEELTAAALHPMNKPVIENGAVVAGYGILAPSVNVEISTSGATSFLKYMAGDGGITLYNTLSSEKYQDLFGEGVFAGKGLIDVDAFNEVLHDAFPEERILSHDILEGGYLRTGFVSDVQITDGYPKRQAAYLDRLERWIRGDWQNIPYIFSDNPMNQLSRYKLFDNLRRSLTPVLAASGILLSLFMPDYAAVITVIICLLSALGGNLLSAIRSIISGGADMLTRTYYSGALPVALGALTRGLLAVILLPLHAYVSVCAIGRALWRSFVSHKNLLEWTTAAQSDRSRGMIDNLVRCLPSVIFAAVIMLFGGSIHRLCGLLFIADIPFALMSGRVYESGISRPDYFMTEKLTSYAASMWKYFQELCTAESNWLPPDNMQETPVHRIANRTSPTNIGLMLLCTLAARDMGFIESAELYDRLDKTLTTVETLEKWHGNLLNWYDTENAKPLEPRYVSTVDSGNFLCCLVALKQGVVEYAAENPKLNEIAVRSERLINGCDILPLYNERRKLFHIGIDLSKNTLSPSYYDLLMSEARMTGYFAVATRKISKKHWGALGRTMASDGRYTGPVSWTGTMFEYFMPYIFLPAPDGTLGNEALKFCLSCQKKRVRNVRINGERPPWGISESGFYAFDRQLNYQYKAHGVQKLGLKRGLNSELVVSPYSSFLALPLITKEAMKNLKYLEKLDVTGRCGFYEAVDFTKNRTSGQDFAVVRSYMAHHVGMSMLCTLNVLKNNIFQHRFMSDDKMSGAECLLQEKIQSGAGVFRDIEKTEVPQPRERIEPHTKEFDCITPLKPRVKLLTNGEWSLAITDVGACMSLYRGVSIFRHSEDLLRNPQGIMAFIEVEGERIPLVKALDYGTQAHQKAVFYNNRVTHSVKTERLSASVTASVHPRLPCEQRRFMIKNTGKSEIDLRLVIYFEPILTGLSEFAEHPAFHKLFIEDTFDEKNEIVTFSKKERNGKKIISLAAGFNKNVKFNHSESRANSTRFSGTEKAVEIDSEFKSERGNPDACAAFEIPIKLSSKGSFETDLFLSAAPTAGEAKNNIVKVRETGGISKSFGAPELFHDGGMESVLADMTVPRLLYGYLVTPEQNELRKKNNSGIPLLWSFGISGDYPFLYIEVNSAEDIQKCVPYAVMIKYLRSFGIRADAVFTFSEGGEYNTPISTALRAALKQKDCESLIGVDGGIHMVNLTKFDEGSRQTLQAFSCYINNEAGLLESEQTELFIPEKVLTIPNSYKSDNTIDNEKQIYFTNNNFIINQAYKNNKNLTKPWCITLCNKTFGTLVSDKSLGFTWAINSRENKLTPWSNDIVADNIGEQLFLVANGNKYNIISNSQATFSPDCAYWRGTAEGFDFEVKVTVPKRGMVKLCDVNVRNTANDSGEFMLIYYTEPVLGVNRKKAYLQKYKTIPDGVVVTSPVSTFDGYFVLKTIHIADYICCNKNEFWNNISPASALDDSCAAVGKRCKIAAGESVSVGFSLSWGATERSALCMPLVANNNDCFKINSIKIDTPYESLNHMINTWIPMQIINSRLYGRTGFYQCGGAWGFRDQLQDSSALILLRPDLVKQQILRCSAVQFEAGDVLHWWHIFTSKNDRIKGVRTRYSDDLLWLPFVTAEYVLGTDDREILKIPVAYLTADELSENENERYFSPAFSAEKGTVYEHCVRAIERANRLGEHGLPLIMGGDWNDGFNNVGIKNRGESVWLAQFMSIVLMKFADLCDIEGDYERGTEYRNRSTAFKTAVDEYAWDGDRYLRAFYDDGEPMGARGAAECAIDSLTQSFAVLADMPDMDRRTTALNTAIRELVDEENGIIKLFSPPFTGHGKNAGYITAYPPGIRENGGQYTHAAVWFCIALLENGMTENGARFLRMINPAENVNSEAKMQKYGSEPFAFTGDVYSSEGAAGCGGWSLYTGSAAWYYRAVIEHLFGIVKNGKKLTITPKLPTNFGHFTTYINYGEIKITISFQFKNKQTLTVDGKTADYIPLDGKSHTAVYE